jgi:DHA1 family 2-module integral membrane pump EmrD-like MFS transporter
MQIDKKIELRVAILAGVLCMIAPFASDIYTPSLPAITHDLSSTAARIQATVMSYFFAAAISQLIYGPLSEKYGRKLMVVIGLSICVIGTVLCALAQTATLLIIARFIQGFGSGACNALFRAIMRDSFSGSKLAKTASLMGIIYPIVFGISPIIGGYIQEISGWRHSFTFAGVIISLSLLAIIFYLPETNHYRHTVTLKTSQVLRQYFQLLTHPVFVGYTLLSSFAFSGFLCFYAVAPYIFENEMGISPSGFGWITIIVESGLLIAQFINSQTVMKYGIHYLLKWGVILMFMSGIILLILSLCRINQPWAIVLPAVIYSAAAGFVFANAMVGAFESFGNMAGIAAAIYGFLQMTISALTGLIMTHLPETTPIPLALVFTLSGLISMGIFYKLRRLQ